MSWNNVIPSWCLVPCKDCGDYHPPDMTCEERAEIRAEREKDDVTKPRTDSDIVRGQEQDDEPS